MISFATNILQLFQAKFPMVDHQVIHVDNNWIWHDAYAAYLSQENFTWHNFSTTMLIYRYESSILRRIQLMLLLWFRVFLLKI